MKPGTVLQGKYRLVSLIADGGRGAVWSAEHLGLDVPVALMLPHAGEASDAAIRARFEAEAKAAASVRSPHAVQVFDFGVDAGTQTPFIVMELSGGESLRDRIEGQRALPPAEVARVVTHVARALGRAHEMSVLHGDLEPAHILLVRNGDEEMAKVLGIARRSGQTSAQGSTGTGTLPASIHYMSPEQIRDSNAVDARSDLWSLGVIAVECLTGQRPFDAEDPAELALQICQGKSKLPSQLGHVPAGVDAWFQRATALRPAERFGSAGEMAAELRALCAVASSPAPEVMDVAAPFTPAVARAPWQAPPLPPAEPPGAAVAERDRAPDWLQPVAFASAAELGGTTPGMSAALEGFPRARSGRRWVLVAAGALLLGGAAYALLAAPGVEPAAPPVAVQTAVQHVQPVRPPTGIRVFGEGPEMTLLVDGREFGPLPRELRDMEPGEHVIQVTGGSRYEAFQQRIMVEPEQVTQIGPIRLKVTRGLATITAGEGAEDAEVTLEVDGAARVLPELPVRLEVETDKPHLLTARRKGYEVFEERITFEDGQAQKSIEIALSESPADEPRRRRRPTPGATSTSGAGRTERNAASEATEAAEQEPARRATLTLTSTPPSNVILNGKPLGPTPRHAVTVEPGTHRVIFIHGENRKTETVEAAPGSNQTVSVNF